MKTTEETKAGVYDLDSNKIGFYAEITSESVSALVDLLFTKAKQMQQSWDAANVIQTDHSKLQKQNNKTLRPQLFLFIRSQGGCIHSALAAYDHIKSISKKVAIITVAEGHVVSAGTILICAGEQRLTMRNSTLLLHQISTTFSGKYANLVYEQKECDLLMKKMCTIYQKTSNMSRANIMKLLHKEIVLSAKQAKRLGLVSGWYG